jgi:dienelactone hydrolase
MLHGCGGRRNFFDDWARRVSAAGWAALIVDSLRPRRIARVEALATVCSGARLQGSERAGDFYAAMAWARAQDWIDQGQIVAAGWSHGAWTMLDALALHPGAEMQHATGLTDLPAEPLEGLSGAMLFYPYAGVACLAGKRPWRLAPVSAAIVCGRDFMVGTATPRRALERQIARGADIDMHVFAESTHAFDEPGTMDIRTRYDPTAIERAKKIFLNLLQRVRARAEHSADAPA